MESHIFKTIFNNITESLILVDNTYSIIEFNDQSVNWSDKIFGYSVQKGKNIFKFISEDNKPLFEEYFLYEKKENNFSIAIVDGMDGVEYWFEYHITPVFKKNKVQYLWITILDVSERKFAVDQIAKSEVRFQSLVKESFDIIFIIEPDGKIQYASDSIENILGYNKKRVIGSNVLDLIHPVDLKSCSSLLKKIVSKENDHFIREFQFRDNYNSWVFLEVAARNLLHDQEIDGIILNARDVTYRKQIEEVLSRINRQNEMILESIGEGVYGIDVNRRITFINAAGAHMLNMAENKIIGENDYDIMEYYLSDFVPFKENPVDITLLKGVAQRFSDALFKLNNGNSIPVEIMLNPIIDNNSITGAVITFLDISDRKKTEEELQKAKEEAEAANTYKSEFLANMSHEIRTPLNSITGFLEVLRNSDLNRNQKNYLNIIEDSASNLLQIINDILDFSRIEKGKLEIDSIEFNPYEEFESAVDLLAAKAYNKNINYQVYIDPHIPKILKGDPLRINQVLINLIGNAIKFTTQGGTIRVEIKVLTQSSKCTLFFKVTDSGIGIPEDKQTIILEAFTQADSSITRKYGGTGLGLAISSSLVKIMGGQLQFTSETEKGSSFFFAIKFDKADNGPVWNVTEKALLFYVKNRDEDVSIISQYMDEMKLAHVVCSDYSSYSNEDFSCAYFFEYEDDNFLQECHEFKNQWQIPLILISKTFKIHYDAIFDYIIYCPITGLKLFKALETISSDENIFHVALKNQATRFNGTILVAEDNANTQKLMTILLKDLGFDLEIASDGVEAIELYKNKSFDLILMDINMPRCDGIEAAKTIRRMEEENDEHSPIPIIALTAKAMKGDRQKILASGMNDYLTKPLNKVMLVSVLHNYFDRTIFQDPKLIKQEKVSSTGSGVDIQKVSEFLGLPVENTKELLRDFLGSIDDYTNPLKEAIESNDLKNIKLYAHKLKGSSASYGFQKLFKLLREIEESVDEQKECDYDELFSFVLEEVEEIKTIAV